MVLKCLVCDLPLQKMDAALICPNGHIIQNTIVEKEKMECEVVGKKKRIYKLRQKIKKAYHRELLVEGEELLLSLYKLFVEAKSYFEFTTDRFFKFMCGTWRYKDGHQNVVKDSIEIIKDVLVNKNYTMYADYSLYMNYQKEVLGICNVDYTSYVNKGNYLDRNTRANINDFVTIVYLSKRWEEEQHNRIYPITLFRNKLTLFNVNERITKIAKNTVEKFEMLETQFLSSTISIHTKIKIFSNPGEYFYPYFNKRYRLCETGVMNDYDEALKNNFIVGFKLDLQTRKEYMDYLIYKLQLCKIPKFDLEQFLFFYEKYCFVQNPNILTIPEIDNAIFIIFYTNYYHASHVYCLTTELTALLDVSKRQMIEMMDEKAMFMKYAFDPITFVSKNKQKVCNNSYANFETTMEFLMEKLFKPNDQKK